MSKLSTLNTIIAACGLSVEDRDGAGQFSRVYPTGRGTMIKFTCDRSWVDFIRTSQNSGNKHLPRFINDFGVVGVVQSGHGQAELYAFELPKYERVFSKDYPFGHLSAFMGSISYLVGMDLFDSCESYEESMMLIDRYTKKLLSAGWDPLEVFEAINLITEVYRRHNCFEDLHSDNYMYDPETGNVIINDPLADRDRMGAFNTDKYGLHDSEVYKDIDLGVAEMICKAVGDIYTPFVNKFKVSTHKDLTPNNTSTTIKVVKSEKFDEVRELTYLKIHKLGKMFGCTFWNTDNALKTIKAMHKQLGDLQC